MSMFQVGISFFLLLIKFDITTVPPPEVMTTYLKVPAGYVLRCFVLLIEDTPLLVSGLTMEWLDPHGNSLKTRSGVSIAIEDGRRRVGIAHKPQMTSDAGVYTCQVTLELSGNMFIASQQPVTRVSQTVFVASEYVYYTYMCNL